MKMFLIGMLVMYLLCGLTIVIISNITADEDVIGWVIALPYVIFFEVSKNIYYWHKYRNLKSVVYNYDTDMWCYCERKDFDRICRVLKRSPNYSLEKYNAVKRIFDAENIKYWDKEYINTGWTYPNVNHRYAPKKVWKNLKYIWDEE